MAGQPQEPTWQSAAQDQARPAWQPPTYTPPAGSPHDATYGYAQGPAQQAIPGQPGQGYPPPSYPPQGAPQWEAIAGLTAAAQPRPGKVRAPGEKGFVGSLFDFSFTSMVTPKVIKALYALFTAWTVLWALIMIRLGFHYYGMVAGIFILVIVVPVFLLLTLGAYRVVLEAFMVLHRIHDELKSIRANSERQG